MSEYIVRSAWDTGHEDFGGFSEIDEAREFRKQHINRLVKKDGVDRTMAENFVRIYILAEVR